VSQTLATLTTSYNTLNIGLLGLLGLVGALLAPQWGQLVERIVPWYGQLLALCIDLAAMVIALGAGQINLGGVCVPILLYDCGQTILQVSSGYRIAGLLPGARSRLNGVFLLFLFAGQTSGTAIMTSIYNSHGWRPTAGCAVAFVGGALVILCLRGPHETGWVGWRGGFGWRKEKLVDLSPNAVTEKTTRR
jgi:predicted MFS family arabinose efflux permease